MKKFLPILIAVILSAPAFVQAQDIIRPRTINEAVKSRTGANLAGSTAVKRTASVKRRAPRAATRTIPEQQEVVIYVDPNQTIANSILCYDDFENVNVCFPSCFYADADTPQMLSLLFTDDGTDPLAQIIYNRFGYQDAIHDLATLLMVYNSIYPAGTADLSGDTLVFTADPGDGTRFYARAFMDDKTLVVAQVNYTAAVAPAIDNFIPILSRNFHL